MMVRKTASKTGDEHEQNADHSHDAAGATNDSGCIAICGYSGKIRRVTKNMIMAYCGSYHWRRWIDRETIAGRE